MGQVYVQTVKVDFQGFVRSPWRYRVVELTAFDIGSTFVFLLFYKWHVAILKRERTDEPD
jgi:hypothetical protein